MILESQLKVILKGIPFCLLLFACRTEYTSFNSYPKAIELTLVAHNLSEDMSQFATGNDEILILLFKQDGNQYKFVSSLYHEFNGIGDSVSFDIGVVGIDTLMVLLLEYDSEVPLDKVVSLAQENVIELISIYDRRDYIRLEEVIGDEDILGYCRLDPTNDNSNSFKGIHKLDRYEYYLTWQKSN